MGFFTGSYVEDGAGLIPPTFLSDKEYARALQCIVPVTTDIIPIDRKQKMIYLAQRKAKPALGWWWFGGKMMPNETPAKAVVNRFTREAGITLPCDRFEFIGIYDMRFKDRQQSPQTVGCHTQAYTYTIELSVEERIHVDANMEPNEFHAKGGLFCFTRERLVREQVYPVIIDVYDHLFPG